MWGATSRAVVIQSLQLFQSTHPCGVRRPNKKTFGLRCVSIHAPVWGATRLGYKLSFCCCFNPRTRVGCDVEGGSYPVVATVSIHAPVWGATPKQKDVWATLCFNPRTRVGCDCCFVCCCSCYRCFNPRTRVGCDFLQD